MRDVRRKRQACMIALQLILIIMMTCLNMYVYSIDVKSKFSSNERVWICETLSEVALMYTTIVLFQIFTLGVNPTSREYRYKQALRILITIFLYIRICHLYFEGLEIN